MLSLSALTTATAALSCVMSPSRFGMKRVAPSVYRHEPYSVAVLPVCTQRVVESLTHAAAEDATVPLAVASPMRVPCPPRLSVRYAVIRFKHETMTFVAPFRVVVGGLVVVEGDRGENIGVVESISKTAPDFPVERSILRSATDEDRDALAVQRVREVDAIATTEKLARQLGLPARIEDAEYQFDRNKLTIFVRRASKSGFVDFRKLQRGLFRQFRCRIWCAYMDEVEAAEAAPRTK